MKHMIKEYPPEGWMYLASHGDFVAYRKGRKTRIYDMGSGKFNEI